MHEFKCPKCGTNFVTERVSGVTVQSCKKCLSVFIDGIEILRLREGPEALEGLVKPGFEIKVKDSNFIEEKCPRCNVAFHNEEYIKNSGIHFKLCTACSSIMFDSSELTKLKNFQISPTMKIYDEFEDIFPVMKRVMAK